jgi:polygalacturonase
MSTLSTHLGLTLPDRIDQVTMDAYKANLKIIDSAAFGYNVKTFGAKGDGATDDSAAIQAALDAIPSGGGVLYFPAGIYRLSAALITKDYITWQGDGYYSTILKPLNNANLAAVITQTDISTGYIVGNIFGDFQIYGNVENGNANIYAINIAGQQCIADRLLIQYTNYGIDFNMAIQGQACYNTIKNCTVSLFDSTGIRIGPRSIVDDCYIYGVGERDYTTRNWMTYGVLLEGWDISIQNNKFIFYNNQAIKISWSWNSVIQGNNFIKPDGININLSGSFNNTIIQNNVFNDYEAGNGISNTNVINVEAINNNEGSYCNISNNIFIPSLYFTRSNFFQEITGCDYNKLIYNQTRGLTTTLVGAHSAKIEL